MSDYLRNAHLEEVGGGRLTARVSKTAGWIEREDGDRVLVLHNTPIVTVRSDDGAVVLNSGGWKTITTKKYMNDGLRDIGLAGWTVYQAQSTWFLYTWMNADGSRRDIYEDTDGRYTFKDGITILPDGTVVGASTATAKQGRNLVKAINEYVAGFVTALFEGRVSAPSGADCWYCSFVVADSDQSWGEASDSDHILSHIKTGYYVPSLLVRAIERYPISQWATSVLWTLWNQDTGLPASAVGGMGGIAERQIKGSLRRYVRQQLGLPPI